MKWKIFLGILACILIGLMILYFLTKHLYSIQTPERLRYVKDYQEFTLSVDVVPDCTNQMFSLFQYQNVVYQGVCVREVYVNYGRTKAPLQMVLESEYITLLDITKKLNKKQTFVIQPEYQMEQKQLDEMVWYEYRRSEKEEGNYLVTVLSKHLQNGKIIEVTFEPFLD